VRLIALYDHSSRFEPSLQEKRIRQAAAIPPHPINFVALNRLAIQHPSILQGHGSESSASVESETVLRAGLRRPVNPLEDVAMQSVEVDPKLGCEGSPAEIDRVNNGSYYKPHLSENVANLLVRPEARGVPQNKQEVLARARATPGVGGSPSVEYAPPVLSL
jgi:hypothetical protein